MSDKPMIEIRNLEDCSKEEFFGNAEARQPRTKDFLNKILSH